MDYSSGFHETFIRSNISSLDFPIISGVDGIKPLKSPFWMVKLNMADSYLLGFSN